MKNIYEYLISRSNPNIKITEDDDFKKYIIGKFGSMFKGQIDKVIDSVFTYLDTAYKEVIYDMLIHLFETRNFHILFTTSTQKADTKAFGEKGTVEFSLALKGVDITVWDFENSTAFNIGFVSHGIIGVSKLKRKNLFDYAGHLNSFGGWKEIIPPYTPIDDVNIDEFTKIIEENII